MSELRGDVREWLCYLEEIGVRELRVPERQAPPQKPRPRSAASGPEAAAPRPARRAAPASGQPAAATAQREPDERSGQGRLLAEPSFDGPAPADPAKRLEEVREELGDCTRCKLHGGRTNIVFGVGNPAAELMFVGEGPGENEDLQGEPFVGRAGQKLDEMIAAIGLSRGEVYIANVVKCRPPKNRDPEADEIEACSPFLVQQIAAIRPKVIVTLGGPATKLLLRTRTGITRLRGQWHSFRGVDVMPTFHPAFVLRNYTKETRMKVWEDLKAAKARAYPEAPA